MRKLVAICVLLAAVGLWATQSLGDTSVPTKTHKVYMVFRRDNSAGTVIDTTNSLKIVAYPVSQDTTGNGMWWTYSKADSFGYWYVQNPAWDIYDFYLCHGTAACSLMTNYRYELIPGRAMGDSVIADTSNFAASVVASHAIKADAVTPAKVLETGAYTMGTLTTTSYVNSDSVDARVATLDSLHSCGLARADSLVVAGDWLIGTEDFSASFSGGTTHWNDGRYISGAAIKSGSVSGAQITDGTIDSTETYTPLCEAVLKTDNIYERSATSDRVNLFAAVRPDSAHYDTVRVSKTVVLAGAGVNGLRTAKVLWKSGAQVGDMVLVMPYSGAWPTYGYGATAITHRQCVFNGIVTATKKIEIVAQVDALWTASTSFTYASGDNAFHVWVLGRP